MVKPLIVLMLAGILSTACSSTSKVAQTKPVAKDASSISMGGVNEDFDPNTLNEPPSKITPKARPQNVEENLTREEPVAQEQVEDMEIIGYRIQILQTQDPDQARIIQEDAIIYLDREAYNIFDSPYYKVRVGDFEKRYDAEVFLEQVLQKGYKGAWIVRTKILKKAPGSETNEDEQGDSGRE